MERVTGIGGFFFVAKDAKLLVEWYEKNLGINRVGQSYEEGSWWQDEGPTVFEPYEAGPNAAETEPRWMLNLRVRDLDAMVAQLRAAGAEVEVDPEHYPNGRFASTHDPEGNPIQLWQPDGTDATRPPGR